MVQAYYDPYIYPVLDALVNGSIMRSEVFDEEGNITESATRLVHLLLLEIPPKFHGKTYKEVVKETITKRQGVCFGLYRHSGHKNAPNPYTYTCPHQDTIISASDCLYVLSIVENENSGNGGVKRNNSKDNSSSLDAEDDEAFTTKSFARPASKLRASNNVGPDSPSLPPTKGKNTASFAVNLETIQKLDKQPSAGEGIQAHDILHQYAQPEMNVGVAKMRSVTPFKRGQSNGTVGGVQEVSLGAGRPFQVPK
jgi:hypothetical protein